jgi:hypothetical protein
MLTFLPQADAVDVAVLVAALAAAVENSVASVADADVVAAVTSEEVPVAALTVSRIRSQARNDSTATQLTCLFCLGGPAAPRGGFNATDESAFPALGGN